MKSSEQIDENEILNDSALKWIVTFTMTILWAILFFFSSFGHRHEIRNFQPPSPAQMNVVAHFDKVERRNILIASECVAKRFV